MIEKAQQLLSLAQEEFKQLTTSEEILFKAVANGEVANYSTDSQELDNPTNADKWGDERTLRADRVVWLCTEQTVVKLLTARRIEILGARIEGELNLEYAQVDFPLFFSRCVFKKPILLRQVKIRGLKLNGTHIVSINASFIKVEGSVVLGNGFQAEGLVSLYGSTIGGNLECNGGKFINPRESALDAEGANITGYVFLRNGFQAEGLVKLYGSTIGGSLVCSGGNFINRQKSALSAVVAKITGSVFLDNGFQAEGLVRLYGSTIGGSLVCNGGKFINPQESALLAEAANITGSVLLRNGFQAEGLVRLYRTTIGGNLDCDGGKFINPQESALNAEAANITGSVFLRNGFQAEGLVRLFRATIGGNLVCSDGKFINPQGIALNAAAANITGSVFLHNGFQVEGEVNLSRAKVQSALFMLEITSPEKMSLNLEFAKIGILHDEEKSWPPQNKLYLSGCVYDSFSEESPLNAEQRLKWLQRQPRLSLQSYEQLAKVLKASGRDSDATQILISKQEDLRRFGGLRWWGNFWNRILGVTIAHGYRPNRALWGMLLFVIVGSIIFNLGCSQGLMSPSKDTPHQLTSPSTQTQTTQNNLKLYTFVYSLLLGCNCSHNVIPSSGKTLNQLTSSSSRTQVVQNAPRFYPFVYSLDSFLPIIDLHQKNNWLPNADIGWGIALQYYLWLHIIFGWILTTLWVAGFTGLVRKLN